ncbi:MAG TPA: hypothetical protein DCM37_01120 [Brucella melitensis]|nr:hypothetical protein BK153_05665 [Brucella melitensis]ARY46788.1 hypothetical protein BK154_05665 [Brucella melitensis]HAK18788.1 hypothetical protein [Brucella melitensis]HCZ30500.1 hypothetical protein [Brucella melitensis]
MPIYLLKTAAICAALISFITSSCSTPSYAYTAKEFKRTWDSKNFFNANKIALVIEYCSAIRAEREIMSYLIDEYIKKSRKETGLSYSISK